MSKALTTSQLPPIPEHRPGPPQMALTTNKTQPVRPEILGERRKRFTGEGMITTGMLGEKPAPAEPEPKKSPKGK